MAWEKFSRNVALPAVTGKYTVSKNGKGRFILSIRQTAVSWPADIDSADVFFGTGEDAGKLRVVPEAEGRGGLKLSHRKHVYLLILPDRPEFGTKTQAELGLAFRGGMGGIVEIDLPRWVAQTETAAEDLADDAEEAHSVEDEARFADVHIDGCFLKFDGQTVKLTSSEASVLALLAAAKGKAVRKKAIHADLYSLDPDGGPDEKIIDVFVSKISPRIKPLGLYILSHSRIGFSLSFSPKAGA